MRTSGDCLLETSRSCDCTFYSGLGITPFARWKKVDQSKIASEMMPYNDANQSYLLSNWSFLTSISHLITEQWVHNLEMRRSEDKYTQVDWSMHFGQDKLTNRQKPFSQKTRTIKIHRYPSLTFRNIRDNKQTLITYQAAKTKMKIICIAETMRRILEELKMRLRGIQ